MSEKLIFDYYYGREAEQFSFYRIPKMLIKDQRFSELSSDAKILYGLMLDRMALSVKNEWQDDEDKTYIIYTLEQIMEDLNCAKQKAVKILSELDNKNGIGLIEKVRRGLGKPDIIYVKNFVGIERISDDSEDGEEENEPSNLHESTEVRKSNFKKYENQTSGSMKIKLQEVPKSYFKKYENQTSESMKIELQEVRKSNSINTDNNNTDFSENNSINLIYPNSDDEVDEPEQNADDEAKRLIDKMELMRIYIKDNVEYDALVAAHVSEHDKIDELIEIMVEVCTSAAEFTKVGKEDKPTPVVKARFEKIHQFTMEYVLTCLRNNTSKVRSIKNYLITTLYNASLTVDNYYSAEVNHDLRGDDE